MVTLRALIYKYPTSRAWWQVTTSASDGEFLEMLEMYRLMSYWLSHCSSSELKRPDMRMLGGYIESASFWLSNNTRSRNYTVCDFLVLEMVYNAGVMKLMRGCTPSNSVNLGSF